jgi:iron complex outermembrane receptor protein
MTNRARPLSRLSLFALSATMASPALAQNEAPTNRPVPESAESADVNDGADIVVTARKREEKLQDVPLAITAFDQQQIEDADIDNVEDVARMTSGFTFTPLFGGAGSTPVIRGLSTTIGEPNVGFFVDGVYQSSRSVMDALLGDNVARIEVVKGPQSALYGRNTFGGAINYITASPTNELSGRVEATVGNFEQRELRAFVSGPIATDTAFFSLGGRIRHQGGFFTNSLTGRDLDNYDSKVITAGLELRPTPGFRVRVRAGYEDTNQGDFPLAYPANTAVPAQPAGPAFPAAFQLIGGDIVAPKTFAVTPGFNDRNFFTGSVTLDVDIGEHTLTAISGLTDLRMNTAIDLDYEARQLRYQTQDIDQREISQEIRLTSPGNKRISYLLGAYYYSFDSDSDIDDRLGADAIGLATQFNGVASLRGQFQGGVRSLLKEKTESFALFGQLIGHVTDQLTLSAEGRYTWETKNVNVNETRQVGGAVGTFVDQAKFRNFVPRFTVDNILVYATAAKAVKVGGFNTVTATGAILPSERTYRPEKSWTYELGLKTTLLDGHLILNGDVFRIDWDDQIVRALGATGAVLNINAGKTRSQGVEFEGTYRLGRRFELNGGFAYTDAHYIRYTFGSLAALGLNPVLDGTVLQYVSKWTFHGAAQFNQPIGNGFDLFGRADISYQSRQSAVQPGISFMPSATIVNLRAGFNKGPFQVRFFVENLTEEDATPAAVYLPSASTRFDFVRGAVGQGPRVGLPAFGGLVLARQPRTFGASVGYKF